MSDDEYAFVAKGKLKLKTDSKITKNKKQKRKDKKKERDSLQKVFNETLEAEHAQRSEENGASTNSENGGRQWTKAEQSIRQQQEKMRNKRIMEKASVTHKQRVEKFNQHLDALTEHFDIPKVSWTK